VFSLTKGSPGRTFPAKSLTTLLAKLCNLGNKFRIYVHSCTWYNKEISQV